MSLWKSIEPEDVEINFEDKEVEINSGFDHNGNQYITLTFAQIKNLYLKIIETEDEAIEAWKRRVK